MRWPRALRRGRRGAARTPARAPAASSPSAPTARPCATGRGEFDGIGYTLQLQRAGAAGRADRHRRRRRLPQPRRRRRRPGRAAGAGLPPRACSAGPARRGAVLNLGGIANLTRAAPPTADRAGFDCGPANVLLDLWCQRHRGRPYDADGAWAASGRVDAALLASLLAEPYFALPPPKSTGRDLFHAAWLRRAHLAGRRRRRGAAGRAGHAGRADRARPCADAVAAPCAATRASCWSAAAARSTAPDGRLARRAAAACRSQHAPTRGLPADAGRGRRLRLAGARLRRSGGPATCRRSPARAARACWARSTRPLKPRARHEKAARRRLVEARRTIRPRSSTRSRRWSSRSGS